MHFSPVEASEWMDFILKAASLVFLIWPGGHFVLSATKAIRNSLKKDFSEREICLFAKGDNKDIFTNRLTDTKLFKKENIKVISTASEVVRASASAVFVVVWDDWKKKEDFDKIIARKENNGNSMIIYSKKKSPQPKKTCEGCGMEIVPKKEDLGMCQKCGEKITRKHIAEIPSDEYNLDGGYFEKLMDMPNTSMCNFTGRLLNDIVLAMITTEKK